MAGTTPVIQKTDLFPQYGIVQAAQVLFRVFCLFGLVFSKQRDLRVRSETLFGK